MRKANASCQRGASTSTRKTTHSALHTTDLPPGVEIDVQALSDVDYHHVKIQCTAVHERDAHQTYEEFRWRGKPVEVLWERVLSLTKHEIINFSN